MNSHQSLGVMAAAFAWSLLQDSSKPTCPMQQASVCPVRALESHPAPAPSHQCGRKSDELDIPDVAPLTQAQKDIILSTAPVLEATGLEITTHFYRNMILAHPELRNVFSESAQRLGHQAQALASAVHAYAANINDLTPILPVVDRIAHKHASLHILPSQYGIVGKHLIQSIVDILGDAVTPEVGDAWYAGYWNLAKVFIQREQELYDGAKATGGWKGWKRCTVTRRIKESDVITSFHLVPEGGVPMYHPGQYTAVSLDVPGLQYKQARQYSISEAPNGQYLRISVKREDGEKSQPGWVSNVLHQSVKEGDTVDIAAPFGDFYLRPELASASTPLVFLSAGVGQTAVVAMLNSQLASARPLTYATVARNRRVLAFNAHLCDAANKHNVAYRLFLSSPEDAVVGKDYDFEGRMTLAPIRDVLHLADPSTEYFICGPVSFMRDRMSELEALGVDGSRIHCELFAAGGVSG